MVRCLRRGPRSGWCRFWPSTPRACRCVRRQIAVRASIIELSCRTALRRVAPGTLGITRPPSASPAGSSFAVVRMVFGVRIERQSKEAGGRDQRARPQRGRLLRWDPADAGPGAITATLLLLRQAHGSPLLDRSSARRRRPICGICVCAFPVRQPHRPPAWDHRNVVLSRLAPQFLLAALASSSSSTFFCVRAVAFFCP